MFVIESPDDNLNRTKILSLPFDDDSVPKTQVNVPLPPVIAEPKAQPLSVLFGFPAPA